MGAPFLQKRKWRSERSTLRQPVGVEGLSTGLAMCAALVIALGQVGCSTRERPPDAKRPADTRNPVDTENVADTTRPADTLFLDSGSITEQSDEAALRRIFGDANVKQDRIEIGEGETLPGTVVFPADSSRELMILWTDTVGRRLPSRLILRGDSSRWFLRPGITLGTPLETLEGLNGRPFTLAGFGWDYAGVVTDWRGGNLATPVRNAKIYLSPPPSKFSTPAYSHVLGDREYSSDLPAMKEVHPVVYQIFYNFPQAGRD